MAEGKKKASELTLEERMEAALVSVAEQPYKVPENWCWTHLGDYIELATDYVANGSFASLKANVRILKNKDYALMVKIQDFSNNFTESLTYTNKHGYEFLEKSVLYGGELILSNVGSIGKVFRVPYFNRPMTLASNSIMIKCFDDSDYDFLYYYFVSPMGQEKLHSITTGTAVLKFNKTDLKTISLPIAPQSEQQRIVLQIESLFSKLNEVKEKAQEVIEGFDSRRAAILHSVFTGGITKKWREEKKIGKDSWRILPIRDVCKGLRYGTSKKSDKSGKVIVLRMGNLQRGEIDWDNVVYTNDDAEIEKYSLLAGDVLFNRTNSAELVGKTSIYRGEHPAIYAGYLIKLDYDRKILNGDFFNYILNSPEAREYCNSVKTDAVNQSNINAKKIGAFTIPVPGLDEQIKIVEIAYNILEVEKKAYEEARESLGKIESIKKTILTKAFRGELGTNDSSDEPAKELLKRILSEATIEKKGSQKQG